MLFLCGHFAVIGLVIITGEVQHSVQNQHFQFIGEGVAKPLRVLSCNLRRDGNIADQLVRTAISAIRGRGKRQYVGRPALFPEAAVQVTHGDVVSDQDIDLAAKPRSALGASGE